MIRTVAADMDNIVRTEDLSRELEKVIERVAGTIGSAHATISDDRIDDVTCLERQVDACAKAYVAGRCDRSLWLQVLDDYEKSWLIAAGHTFQTDSDSSQTLAA